MDSKPRRLWRWIGIKWRRDALLSVGALSMIRLGEYAVGVICLVVAGIAAISKIQHWVGISDLAAPTKAIKIAGYVGVAGLVVGVALVSNRVRADSPWSNLLRKHPIVLKQNTPGSLGESDPRITLYIGFPSAAPRLMIESLRAEDRNIYIRVGLPVRVNKAVADDPARVHVNTERRRVRSLCSVFGGQDTRISSPRNSRGDFSNCCYVEERRYYRNRRIV